MADQASSSELSYGLPSLFRLDGRAAIVTGAGRGLGRGMALALAGAGAQVALWDVNADDLREAADEVRARGGIASTQVVDVTDGQQVVAGVAEATSRFAGLHILVNNAGVTTRAPFEALEESEWLRVMQVNLTGVYQCCKAVARQMFDHGGGSVINIASISGLVGNRGGDNSAYCASKGGIIALTRSLAVEWAARGVRVNAIAPGYFVTPMTDRLKQRDPSFYQELIDRVPMGRFGQAEDLAGAVLFLAGPASAFVTGHVLVVDGGYTAW